jgi:transcriptional regulator with XRE-family HTH domain
MNLAIGVNIRTLRQEKNISIKELSEQTGLTSSFLSQLEKGKTMPSISSLKGIADKLNTTISYLVGEDNFVPSPVVREKERQHVRYAHGMSMFFLASRDQNKQMEPLLFQLSEKASSGKKPYKHFGQEFVLVLKGEMEVKLNDQLYNLRKGDSIYFNSNIPHSFRNLNKGKTEAIWVDTPPTF